MRKLMKYLKKYAGQIFLILILLIIQALCDLTLPSYTSNIVNVGIQQSGIESSVPQVMGEATYNGVKQFMTEDGIQLMDQSYVLVQGEQWLEDSKSNKDIGSNTIKILESMKQGNYFVLKTHSLESEQLEQLEDELVMPQMYLAAMNMSAQSDGDMSLDMEQLMSGDGQGEIPDLLAEQIGIEFVKGEYQNLGVDLDGLQSRYIFATGGKMVALALLVMVSACLVAVLASRISAAVSKELRGNVFRTVVGFSSGEFEKFSIASLITRSTNDIQQVQMLIVMMLRMVLYAPILALGGIYKVFTTNAKMSWILAVGVAVLLIIIGTLFITVMPKFKLMQKLVDKVNLVAREILSGLPVIRAFSTQEHEKKRFDKANKDLTKNMLFVNRVMSCMMPLMMLIMNGLTIAIVWVGAGHIDQGNMQVGDVMAFIQYTMMIIMSFLVLAMVSVMLPRASVAANRVDEILTTPLSIVEKEKPKAFETAKKGQVVFDHVHFKYPGADEDVLSDISFTAMPGQTTAIIGSTGSGKSTLVRLIPRFYDVTEGKILVDGVDIREVSGKELRDRIGYVPQKGVLFSGTIASNIKYFNEDAPDEVMERAAQIAQAKDFIEEKELKYNSPIAQGGGNVSGGQRQRISIARAIAKNPEIYVFDDSFSALDYKTDAVLRKALKEETKECAVIIVAQRISTILNAEQIIVLDEGKVAGKGTHEELMENCDVYRQIALSQLSEKELGKGGVQ